MLCFGHQRILLGTASSIDSDVKSTTDSDNDFLSSSELLRGVYVYRATWGTEPQYNPPKLT